jgi:hypothetical protein
MTLRDKADVLASKDGNLHVTVKVCGLVVSVDGYTCKSAAA